MKQSHVTHTFDKHCIELNIYMYMSYRENLTIKPCLQTFLNIDICKED